MGLRRKSRELALQFLYGHDVRSGQWTDKSQPGELSRFRTSFEVDDKSFAYGQDIVCGVLANREKIDELLGRHTKNWRLERLTAVDRNIMRIAAWEILHKNDVPARVAINEALEISKRFSDPESVSFINGVLDGLASEHGAGSSCQDD